MDHHPSPFLRSLAVAIAAFALVSFASVDNAYADKSSVSITAPIAATEGSQITITVTASHDANNFFHYTNWLYIMINGQEIARWDYSWRKRPEAKIFTKDITYTVTGPMNIKAEANCNIHGSKGPQTLKVTVTGK